DGALAWGRGAIVHQPEHSAAHVTSPERRAIVGVLHHLLDQPPERLDARPGFAAAQDPPSLDVPGRQVLERPAALVLRRDSARPLRARLQRRVPADAGLYAGLLVAAEDLVEWVEPLPLVVALVQVQDYRGLGEEVGGAGEEPVLVLPGLDRVPVQDLPDGGAADGLVQLLARPLGQIGGGLPAQRVAGAGDH